MACGGVQGQSSGEHGCEGCSWVIVLDVLWSTLCPMDGFFPRLCFSGRARREEEEEARRPAVLHAYWLSVALVSVFQNAFGHPKPQ